MFQPDWLVALKEKLSRKRIILMAICAILSLVLIAILGIAGFDYWFLVAILLAACVFFIGGIIAISMKVKMRHYNGNIIAVYSGVLKGSLYINGMLFDEGIAMFSLTLYGQLPTGEEVIAKIDAWGDITFYIGNTSNNQGINLS